MIIKTKTLNLTTFLIAMLPSSCCLSAMYYYEDRLSTEVVSLVTVSPVVLTNSRGKAKLKYRDVKWPQTAEMSMKFIDKGIINL